jgi:hypothetical protein
MKHHTISRTSVPICINTEPVPCIPVVVSPADLNGIYDFFLKSRPAKRAPIGKETIVLIYEGEGGNA